MKRNVFLFVYGLAILLMGSGAVNAKQPFLGTREDYLVTDGGPNSLTYGDFNGDGKIDLAVSGSTTVDITPTIFTGNGDGTFIKIGELSGVSGGRLIVGDFNNDGRLDLAIASNGSFSICLGNGDGIFQCLTAQIIPPTTSGGAGAVGELAVGDFNKDGKLDLALPAGEGISVLLGNGDGTFQTPANYPVGSGGGGRTFEVSTGDYNQDGNPDLAVIGNSTLTIFLGVGNGSLVPKANYSTAYTVEGIKSADFNNDGKLDLATVIYGNTDSFQVYLGNGDGTFQSARAYNGGESYPYSLNVADLNGDGNIDVIVAGCVNLGHGNGTFQTSVCYPAGGEGIVAADFNGDGKLDLAIGGRFGRSSGGFFGVLLGMGDGTFPQPQEYDSGGEYSQPEGVIVRDFNKDGKLDIATSNSNSNNISVMLGWGKGIFLPKTDYPVGISPSSLISADFNGDGVADIAVANEGSNAISILIGNGDGTLQGAVNYSVGSASAVTAGDFNNDGKFDLAAYGADGTVSLLRGNGDGTFQPAGSLLGRGWAYFAYMTRNANWIASGDFNGDGKIDLAITDYISGHGVSVYIGNGDFSFQYQAKYATGGYPYCITTGDFNNDGILDLATADAGQDYVSVLLGVGDGTFRSAVRYRAGLNPVYITAVDFNGDGKLDLAVANLYSSNISVLSGKGDGTFGELIHYGAVGATAVASGDFDGNGTIEFAVAGHGKSTGSSGIVTILGNIVPGAPTGLTASAGNASATVSFTAPSSNGGSAITGYTVTSNPAGGFDTNAGTTGLRHVITGLTNGTPYTFTVTANNSVGTGPPSTPSNALVPTAPLATLTSLSISGSSLVSEGATETYSASAIFSDNSIQSVTPSWAVTGSAATISNAGLLTANLVSDNQIVTVNATYTAGGVTLTAAKSVTIVDLTSGRTATSINVVGGWNLMGNSSTGSLDVATTFGDTNKVISVWKWVAGTTKWAFYAPSLVGQALTNYAASKGYDVLITIAGGQGFWVNAKSAFAAPVASGTVVTSASFQSIASGWNLIAIGDNKTPRGFNDALSTTPLTAGVFPINITSLWAWDAAQSNWYFYAPGLDRSDELSAYVTSKSYLDFGTRVLDPTRGFWVNKP